MNSFIQAHLSKVTGMISGWDRVRFRGTIRMLANVPGLEDIEGAQKLLDQQVTFNFGEALSALSGRVNPAWESLRVGCDASYDWSADESEWASDLMFRSHEELSRLYVRLLRQGMEGMGSLDVLRFLGRRVKETIPSRLALDVTSDLKSRAEGIRIKHRMGYEEQDWK